MIKKELASLLAYPEDSVGRLMTPDYLAINESFTVKETLEYIRKNGKNSETIDVIYILDNNGILLDDLRIRELLLASPDTPVKKLMDDRLIYLNADDPQEDAIKVFKMNNRVALPVINSQGILLGIVTIDDVLWVVDEEYSEDMQRVGGTGVLDEPYLDMPIHRLVKKEGRVAYRTFHW
ncbi:MAG: CBS domain-containing protein [Dysgonomonas sp.]